MDDEMWVLFKEIKDEEDKQSTFHMSQHAHQYLALNSHL